MQPMSSLVCLSYVQVNDRSIEGLRHAEVVELIRAGGRETRLLVVDPETDELFNRLGIVPTSTHLKGAECACVVHQHAHISVWELLGKSTEAD